LFEYNQRLSLVPEKPTDFLTAAKSHADEQIERSNCFKSLKKTHLMSQKAIVFLFFLKVVYKSYL
jgi:hypothetical protein